MAALWSQIEDVRSMLEELITLDDDGNIRKPKKMFFDSMIFSGDTIHIWKDGTYYKAKISRPRDQMPDPYPKRNADDD